MQENEQNYTDQEVVEETENADVEAVSEEEALNAEASSSTTEQKNKDQSWKELREKAELADKLKKERDEYYNLLRQVEDHYRAQPKQAEDQFDLDSIDDDDLPDGKTLKKLFRQQQKERQELQSYIKRQQQVQYEYAVKNELSSRFGDFDSVVNEENIVKLREMRPGLARQLHSTPDIKEKAIETYYAIKQLGIYENPGERMERERIHQNAKKPRSINTVADRGSDPLDYASTFSGGLTPEMKRKLYEDALKKSGRS